MIPEAKSGSLEFSKLVPVPIPAGPQDDSSRVLGEPYGQPLPPIGSQDCVEALIIEPGLLAGGAKDEGVGQLHVPGQGCEGGRCRGVEEATECEHWKHVNC